MLHSGSVCRCTQAYRILLRNKPCERSEDASEE
jgi:hypothetical protein